MLAKAKAILADKTTLVANYDEFKQVLRARAASSRQHGATAPNAKPNQRRNRRNRRVRPFEKEEAHTGCVYCGKEAKEVVYFARSY